jgi:hypothetical protein
MFKMFTAMSLVVVSAASALAFPPAVPAPAPEVAGGVLGMTFAAGLVYLPPQASPRPVVNLYVELLMS